MYTLKPFVLFLVICVLGLGAIIYGLPSFPGAEGYGADTPGGRGGTVVHVTNLNDAGTGSLRAALTGGNLRIIVFDVGGVINVQSYLWIPRGNNHITIAGQTAPGGVTLSGGGIGSEVENIGGPVTDVIMRHIRVRGAHNVMVPGSEGGDGINIYSCGDAKWVLDHVSASWACDEIGDFIGSRYITLQWAIINNAALYGQGGCFHAEGDHNYGTIGAYGSDFHTYHHIYWAHLDYRCPLYGGYGYDGTIVQVDVRNNVTYNACLGFNFDTNVKGNVVGCYWKLGPNAKQYNRFGTMADNISIYMADCYNNEATNKTTPYPFAPDPNEMWWYPGDADGTTWLTQPVNTPAVTTQPVMTAKDLVLSKSGAFPRDSLDRRVVREIELGTGAWGKQDAPLTHPLMGTPSPTDTDRDGMPDAWETVNGLNPSTADDKADKDGDGYTNIEEYINDVAEILVGNPTANPTGGVESVYNAGYVSVHPEHNQWVKKGNLLNVSPNPFNQRVTFELHIAEHDLQNAVINIFDVNGKMVYSSHVGGRDTARRVPTCTWDGKNIAGQSVPPGIYVVHLTDGNRILANEKIIMIR